MNRKEKLFIKVISLILVVTFIVQEVSYAYPQDSSLGLNFLKPFESVIHNHSLFEPPLNFCALQEIHKGAKDVFIIHIQDAHSNYSGQMNLANTLDELMTKYKIQNILVEGGSKDNSLTEIKKIAPKSVWQTVAKKFLLEGKIQGEEYLNLISDHPMKILGIEDRPLYFEGLKHYAELEQKREEI